MEGMLAPGVGVMGVDEHTAVIVDVVGRTASVHGAGGLTLRVQGVSQVVPSGESIALADLARILAGDSSAPVAGALVPADDGVDVAAPEAADEVATSLGAAAVDLKSRFDACLADADADGALEACLDLEDAIHAWSSDTLQSDDIDVARQALRSMMVELAGSAVLGLRDPRTILEPVVDVVLDARRRVREGKDYATSDAIRDGLAAAGIEVRDTPEGVAWDIVED
jgi:hypothetical protein